MSKFSNADAAVVLVSWYLLYCKSFYLQIRIFLLTKQELKYFSSIPGSGCTFERSMFVVAEGRKRCRDAFRVCL